MDRITGIIAAFLIALAFSACDGVNKNIDKELLPQSSGKYGEVLVVIDTAYENGKSGKQVRQIFNKMMVGLPQAETMFRMSTVAPASFKSILKRSRNILKLHIGNNRKTNINIEEDVWAKNQLMIQITAASDTDAARILRKNQQTIRDYFNEKELDRLKNQYAKNPQEKLIEDIKDKYDISLLIPPGFILMENNEKGFWIRKEKKVGKHQVTQGLMVYRTPYVSDSLFLLKQMIASRNKFTKPNIEGARDSSYMKVYEEYPTDTSEINLNQNYVKVYRGLWNMENDFMGGPFLHYTLVDTTNSELVHLDGFVFAPKFGKREYLRELQAIMRTAKLNN
ncbi:MAG: DUF4837 family protein [Vicingaceae bacterium]